MRPDKIHKIKVSISGFGKAQVEEGLPYLWAELRSRPWLFEPEVFWDDVTMQLIIIVGYDLEERTEEGAGEEISDCVAATMHLDKKIEFDIQRIQ
jgi:hypothetical protein